MVNRSKPPPSLVLTERAPPPAVGQNLGVLSRLLRAGRRMKPWKENGAAISSEEVNFLVFRYLQESGESLFRSIRLTRVTISREAAPERRRARYTRYILTPTACKRLDPKHISPACRSNPLKLGRFRFRCLKTCRGCSNDPYFVSHTYAPRARCDGDIG